MNSIIWIMPQHVKVSIIYRTGTTIVLSVYLEYVVIATKFSENTCFAQEVKKIFDEMASTTTIHFPNSY